MNTKVAKLENGNKISKLAANIDSLMNTNNLNINQLAQALNIPMMTVRRLLSGETADPRVSTLKLVADYFGVTVDCLLEDSGHLAYNAAKGTRPVFVPVLTWEMAEKMDTVASLDLSKWRVWQPVSLNEQGAISKNAFALESRPSMYPRFPQETLFIIDPDVSPSDGDIVLIKVNNELTLRELIIDPPEWKLQPIVSSSSTLSYQKEKHEIKGVNLLTILYNRRIYD